MSTNPHHGSSFEDFLRDEGPGRLEEATIQAKKRVIAWQIEQRRKAKKITKVEMAKRMGTSRAELDRVLNPDYAGVQIDTLARAAAAVGADLQIELIEP
jgi:antitoxin HicB